MILKVTKRQATLSDEPKSVVSMTTLFFKFTQCDL